MRTFHLIAALALFCKHAAASNDGYCGEGVWDDSASFEGDDGDVITCPDIADYLQSLGVSPGDLQECGNSEVASVMPIIDFAGCCGDQGYSMCSQNPATICSDPAEWNGDAINDMTGVSCAMIASSLAMPQEDGSTINQGLPFDQACDTCFGTYVMAFDLAGSCCGGGAVACSDITMDYSCLEGSENEGSENEGSENEGSEGGSPSEDCLEGCITDCFGSDKFMEGDKWDKDSCICLVNDCYDSRDCDRNDVELIEGFVATGCGAADYSYDVSYDYEDIEDMAEEAANEDGALALGLSAGAVALIAAVM